MRQDGKGGNRMVVGEMSLKEEAEAVRKELPNDALDKLNEAQLWTIYMALYYHTDLVEPLKEATQDLARRVHEFGRGKYKWLKV